MLRPDGAVRWVRDTAFPIRDEFGRAHRIGGITVDVTRVEGTWIYIVDGGEASRLHLAALLNDAGYDVKTFATTNDFLEVAPMLLPGCAILELDGCGNEALVVPRELKARGIEMPIIVVGGAAGDVRTAVQALKAGATDWLEGSYEPQILLAAVADAFARGGDAGGREADHEVDRVGAGARHGIHRGHPPGGDGVEAVGGALLHALVVEGAAAEVYILRDYLGQEERRIVGPQDHVAEGACRRQRALRVLHRQVGKHRDVAHVKAREVRAVADGAEAELHVGYRVLAAALQRLQQLRLLERVYRGAEQRQANRIPYDQHVFAAEAKEPAVAVYVHKAVELGGEEALGEGLAPLEQRGLLRGGLQRDGLQGVEGGRLARVVDQRVVEGDGDRVDAEALVGLDEEVQRHAVLVAFAGRVGAVVDGVAVVAERVHEAIHESERPRYVERVEAGRRFDDVEEEQLGDAPHRHAVVQLLGEARLELLALVFGQALHVHVGGIDERRVGGIVAHGGAGGEKEQRGSDEKTNFEAVHRRSCRFDHRIVAINAE
ncbi:MAG: response regulator [Chitinophagaceae bacterium]|nr:MAG: response regulator [Chitinophagaceae bacterium]